VVNGAHVEALHAEQIAHGVGERGGAGRGRDRMRTVRGRRRGRGRGRDRALHVVDRRRGGGCRGGRRCGGRVGRILVGSGRARCSGSDYRSQQVVVRGSGGGRRGRVGSGGGRRRQGVRRVAIGGGGGCRDHHQLTVCASAGRSRLGQIRWEHHFLRLCLLALDLEMSDRDR